MWYQCPGEAAAGETISELGSSPTEAMGAMMQEKRLPRKEARTRSATWGQKIIIRWALNQAQMKGKPGENRSSSWLPSVTVAKRHHLQKCVPVQGNLCYEKNQNVILLECIGLKDAVTLFTVFGCCNIYKNPVGLS